jgi:hypothetical protein
MLDHLSSCSIDRRSFTPDRDDSLVARMRAEFAEMPGLSLTRAQACRLWALDSATCQRALDRLVEAGVLTTSDRGCYLVPSAAA